jgi:phage baseplate assembly protein gpV
MNESFAFSDLFRRVANLIRIGKIAEVDGTQVKVQIGKVKTNWLPIVSMAGDTSVWIPISVGEQVAVISPYGEMAQSFVIRSIHYNKYAAPENKNDIFIKSKADVKVECEGGFEGKFNSGFELETKDTYIYVREDSVKVKCGNAEFSVADGRVSFNSGNGSGIFENDRVTLNAGGASITLSSDGIQLSCGGSTIALSDSNISLNSSNISSTPPICKCLGGL